MTLAESQFEEEKSKVMNTIYQNLKAIKITENQKQCEECSDDKSL